MGTVYKVKELRRYLLIGNTRWHWAIEHKDSWEFIHKIPDEESIRDIENFNFKWASVGKIPNHDIFKTTNQITLKDIPLLNMPDWLGIDRALAGWEAFRKSKEKGIASQGLLIADAGTILSITKITSNGSFGGGQLVPGQKLQLLAMANGAKNLKEPQKNTHELMMFPSSTEEAMQRGSIQSLLGTITEAISDNDMPIWLCGGEMPLVIAQLQKKNFNINHRPNLVLEGMVNILNSTNQDLDPVIFD